MIDTRNETPERYQAAEQIRSLLVAANHAGLYQRQPHRYPIPPETTKRVNFACEQLDKLKVSWAIQNNALTIVSDADTSKIWNLLYSSNFDILARQILDGKVSSGKIIA